MRVKTNRPGHTGSHPRATVPAPTSAAMPGAHPRQGFSRTAIAYAVWIAVAGAGLTIATPQPALAQASAQQPQGARQSYSIPAGPLAPALRSLASTANLLLTFTADQTDGRTTAGINGQYTAQEALAALLARSGLQAVRLDNGAYVLRASPTAQAAPAEGGRREPTLAAVRVDATSGPADLPKPYAGGQVARGGQLGMLGNKDVMDAPFSQTNYTSKAIKDQQAQTVQEILLNDPSILTKQNSAGDEDGSLTIRGFSTTMAAGSGTLNGLAGMAPLRSPDLDYIERVEVLRGPSALLNGMATTGAAGAGASGAGGSYNLVTKQAGDEPLTQLTTRYGSRSQLGAHVDVGRRLGAEKQFGIRFNGAFRKGDTPVKPVSAEVGSAALNLDYRSERFRVAADVAHHWSEASPQAVQQLVVNGTGGGFVFIPKAPDAGTSLNPPWSRQPSKLTLGMVRGEVDITETVAAYGAIGRQKLDFSLIGPAQPTLRDASGTFGWNLLEHTNFSYDVQSMHAGLRATAVTGPVGHALNLHLSKARTEIGEAATQIRNFNDTTNLYNPTFGPAVFIADPGSPRRTGETRVSSFGIADTLSMLDKRIQLTVGVRRQEVETASFNAAGARNVPSYASDAWTPAAGLVVKPWQQNVSLYANYIENLQAGIIVGSQFFNAREVIPPFVSKQYEAGVKVDWGTMTTTLAVFQINQPNTVSIPTPGDPRPTLVLDGEQRNRGIELNAYGEPMRGVRTMAGVALIDAVQLKTQGGVNDGHRQDGIPKIRTVVSGEWDTSFLPGLTLTGRLTYTGNQVASSSNESLKLPSWTVVDLGARYALQSTWTKEPIVVRLTVDNVFDKDYWAGTNFRYAQLGAPRTVRLSATFSL